LPHTSIEIFDSHSLKEIRSSSFGFVGDVSRKDLMSLASSGPIFGRFLGGNFRFCPFWEIALKQSRRVGL
jgi:hypothetical protein